MGVDNSRDEETGRFLPGRSENPLGRPRGQRLRDEIEQILVKADLTGVPHIQQLATKLVEMALSGNLRALELILKRVWPERVAVNDAPRFRVSNYQLGNGGLLDASGLDIDELEYRIRDFERRFPDTLSLFDAGAAGFFRSMTEAMNASEDGEEGAETDEEDDWPRRRNKTAGARSKDSRECSTPSNAPTITPTDNP